MTDDDTSSSFNRELCVLLEMLVRLPDILSCCCPFKLNEDEGDREEMEGSEDDIEGKEASFQN